MGAGPARLGAPATAGADVTTSDGTGKDWLDLAFEVHGGPLPRDHRRDLAAAVERALPWLCDVPGAALRLVHLVPMAAGDQGLWLVSRRSRLQLRVPRKHAADAGALQDRSLDLAGVGLRVGLLHVRDLRPWHTLHAHLVATDADDEAAFMHQVNTELAARGLPGRPICGRRQQLDGDALHGYSLMLDGLTPKDSMRLLEQGLGQHRRLGCGVFVAHKSTAAVGTPQW
jgi:CRISPR-associated protein Cas6